MIGRVFGRLTVVSEGPRSKWNYRTYNCICGCGKSKQVLYANLKNGVTRSCGCLHKEKFHRMITKHGYKSYGPIYDLWRGMVRRCTDMNSPAWGSYGGRGITVCAEWLNSFEQFLLDMGPRPDGFDIDRINNDKGYYPKNCRWVTHKENCRNRRTARIITFNGVTLSMSEWAEKIGIKPVTLSGRINTQGWSIERALTYTNMRTKQHNENNIVPMCAP